MFVFIHCVTNIVCGKQVRWHSFCTLCIPKAMIFIGKPNVPMVEEVGYFLSNIGIRLWQCGDLPLYLQQKY